jgi:hypothetical protein
VRRDGGARPSPSTGSNDRPLPEVRPCRHMQSVGSFDRLAADAKAEHVFLELLASYIKQERDVSPKVSNSYAPAVFAKRPEAGGLSKRILEGAMERLLKAKRIAVETIGPPSRRYSRIVLASEEGGT